MAPIVTTGVSRRREKHFFTHPWNGNHADGPKPAQSHDSDHTKKIHDRLPNISQPQIKHVGITGVGAIAKKRASKISLLYFSTMRGKPRICGWLLVGIAKRSRTTAV